MEPTSSRVIEQHAFVAAQKITQVFEQARQTGKVVLIPYFMCGYPTVQQSVNVVLAAIAGGADIIELGMPFSDPLADGATIQHAGQVALQNGMNIRGCMHIARQIADQCETPLILMGYYNPILAYGINRFCNDAHDAGVSGLIVPDLPPEEAQLLQDAATQYGLTLIFLVPPTTPDERIAMIAKLSTKGHKGFVYCVSLSGVTGARNDLPPHLHSFIERVRSFTKDKELPLAVGFGLNTPAHIAHVSRYAEGAVVGSALVNLLDQHAASEQVEAVERYIRSLK
jgi:tryptophan synthase alpha chain